MKTKTKLSFLVLFLWMIVIQAIYTDDTCPNGMRKTYLDETTASEEGAARNYVPAINFYEGAGALWYRRKVLIEPRFEVHLKAGIEAIDIIENSAEQSLEGFTIVISKNKNKLTTSTSDYIGYYGFTKSYIIEFDFNKNRNDPDDSSFSFKYCDSECSNDDANSLRSGKLNSQRFDPTKNMNWDFRLIYVDKKLSLYSGPNELIFSYSVDLYNELQSNTAYIGFTGYMRGNRRELNVLGTFVCEDNFDISKMSGKFYVNDKELDTYTYKAGETVQYLFSFINNKGQVIPHCFKQGIWTYSFSLSLDCQASNLQIRMKDEYSLFLSMNACNVLGEHKIGISESSHGVGPEKTYTIVGGALNKINLIGHDGVVGNLGTDTELSNGVRTLIYGSSDKVFPLKSGSLTITLDFDLLDSFGNYADVGDSSSQMLSTAGFSLAVANSATLSMKKLNGHYQLIITISKTGDYQIVKNGYMSETIKFSVIVGGVSTDNSYCTIEEYTATPTLKQGETVNYKCYFKDGKGNLININTFISLEEYDFSCQTKRTSPTSKTYTNTPKNSGDYYSCPFTISEPGVYQFYGYLTPKGKTTKTTVKAKINIFYVSSTSFSLNGAKIFNYYTKKWVNMNEEIQYRNDAKGKLTSLDLIDSQGVLISKYKAYPEDFDASRIKVEVYSPHDYEYSFGKFEAQVYTDGGKQYIGIFNEKRTPSDNIIRRSSFEYHLKITYNKEDGTVEEKLVILKYHVDTLKISSYTTCFHDLDISKTNIDMASDLNLIINSEEKIATIELRTGDYNLYNYDIGKSNIKIELESSGSMSYRIVPLSIAGTYEVYVTLKKAYNGRIRLLIKGQIVRYGGTYAGEAEACYLKFKEPELFNHTGTEFKEHYYEYLGDFPEGGNFEYFFTIYDRNWNLLTRPDYFSNFADIYSHQFGNDVTKFSIGYNTAEKAFYFRDKLDFESKIYTWIFFMRDGTCNNKYYITYDQSRIITSVSISYSYYKLLYNNLNINEYAYVDVFLKDGNNAFMGITDGKLEDLRTNVRFEAKDTKTNQIYPFEFNQITNSYAIRFRMKCTVASTFEVNAYYKKEDVLASGSKMLTVIAPQFSLKYSIFQIILDSTMEMNPNTKVTIQNTLQIPFYNLILYTSDGIKTTFTSDSTFNCVMTGKDVTMTLDATKKTDYIQFTYKSTDKERFKSLLIGDYTLTVTADDESLNYQLYLLGDGETDYSNLEDKDISQTLVTPTHIDGNAGKANTITVEFRAKDGLRWNYWGSVSSFSFKNSYGLSGNNFVTKVTQGYKKGQYLISVTQNKITDKGDNILTILYNKEEIPQKVSLTIKGGDFKKLVLVDGPTDGNVINHPILTFEPVDNYNNLITFDSVNQEYLNSLTTAKSLDGVSLTPNNYIENNRLKVQYKTTISTNVQVNSQYLDEPISYRIKSGPIDPETSYAEMQTTSQAAGSNYTIIIYPKDVYLNDIDDLNENDMNQFITYYEKVEDQEQTPPIKNCKLIEGYSSAIDVIIRKLVEEENVYDSIECTTPISYIGNIAFHVNYVKDEIECKGCVFSVIASQFDFKNTKTYYKNIEYFLDENKQNEVEAKKDPVFEISFYDQFKNSYTNIEFINNLNIITTFVGADIKLCVTNSGIKKIATLCPSTNGDDNINKWQYITNGDNYQLIVQDKDIPENKITYPITIVRGDNGSSDDADYSKTNFNPTTITIQAGDEGKTIMEIRTKDNIRKNYWFSDISEKIKVEFNKDKDSCSYKVEKGDLPGQYSIKVICTKSNDNNGFTVTVDSNKINQTIKLIVKSGPAYYLEVEEKDKFTVSGDKYTWKNSVSNDDDINFLFKLQDKYKNYITTSVIGKNQISINSEKYASDETKYNLEFKDSNKDYLFTDKIYTAITKHTWDITCLESNRKYSFIYNRVPGKVDVSQSYWSIDKTEYTIQETSTVLVTLLDRYGVNLGIIEGKLLQEKDKLKVITHKDKDLYYEHNSITSENKLKYLYIYKEIGNYKVSVTYDGQQIKNKVDITVSYQKIDLKTSQLYYDVGDGNENLMLTSVQTNINNLEVCPIYKLYLYTEAGERITLYDKKISSSCIMTYNDINSWELDVSNKDDYIYISHKDCDTEFKKLPQALYNLEVTIDGDLVKYPLYLMGEKDVSIHKNYDISKTFVKPTYIDGVAGEKYQIDIEFRGSDGLRWNYEVNINSLEYTNSYGLDSNDLIIEKQQGDKNGQMKLFVIQKKATTGKNDNILYLSYEMKNIPQTVTLHIKCSPNLSELVYHSGAEDGTVINPSIVKFIPKDEFGNLFTDLFDETKYPKEKLEKLTNGVSIDGYPVTTNSYVSDNQYLNVQYGCKKVTTMKVTSNYNPNEYKYKLWSGPIYADTSYAKIEKTEGVIAGDTSKLIIYPRDIYENIVTNATKDDFDKFNVDYEVNKDYKQDITDKCDTSKFVEDFYCQTIITKSGDVEFTVGYDNKGVKCINCEFNIGADKLDFSKTKVYNKNENKEMSQTELNTLPVTVNPNFLLKFFDKYENPITNKNEVESLKVSTEIVVTDVKLCVSNNDLAKLSTLCKSTNGDENEERWKYLPNGDGYKLIVTETTKNEKLTYPIQLTGGYTGEGSGPVDSSKTYFEPTEKTLVAGEEGMIFMELRTEEEKRKNYWYKEPDKNIIVKFPSTQKNCTYKLDKAEKPGQYFIKFKCYKTSNPFETIVEIEKKDAPTPITLTVVPGNPAYSKLFRMTKDEEEITQSYLGSVSVEDKFQMINRLYDQYDNLITNINLGLLQIKMAPVNNSKSHTWSAEPSAQPNGDIIITLKSTFAIEHIVVGAYFPLEKYSIIFTPGKENADNSELDVSHRERWVDEEVYIYITPYDKYNNYIDAIRYKDTSPYQVKYTNEGETTKVIMEKYSIKEIDGRNVLVYPGKFYVRGTTNVYGYIDTAPIKCVYCRIKINAKDIYFLNNNAFRFEYSKNDFEELKDGAVEKNKKEEPIYRLYPRDKYGNKIDTIPENILKTYTAHLASQSESTEYYFKLNNNETANQEYAEFVINDIPGKDPYNALVGGFYDLIFTDGKDRLVYNITLQGDGKGGSNEPVDYQNTHIIEENLKFVAGNTGYMIIELRTTKNIRKNYWPLDLKFTIKSCNKEDKTFNFIEEKAGTMGVYYITVTTQKANTYPKLEECPLEVYVNDELVKNLKPKMEVSPDAVVVTKILEEYYKDGKSSAVLIDGNADTNYVFEVKSYDQYNNLAETIQEVVGIQVAYKGGNVVDKTTSVTDDATGKRKYTVPATKAGTYVVSTDKSGPHGLYLPNESIFVIHPGAIDLSKTIVEAKATPIQAGSKPAVIIEAFDKYGNALYINDYLNKFQATFIDPKNEEHTSKGAIDKILTKPVYTSNTPVCIVGKVYVTVIYDGKDKVDTSNVVIDVYPGEPDPSKSILTREVKGSFIQYKNQSSFSVDVYESLLLNVTLYDKYNNFISTIPSDSKVLNPLMSGNYMSEIQFNVTKLTSYFRLDFNENEEYIHIYQHLVKGTYDLTYKVNTTLGEASFYYNIIVVNGDDKHGNGPYVIEKCVLTPKNTSFIAGNYEEFTLELRTAQGLLYNDDIDIDNDVLIKIVNEDKSFKEEVSKAGSDYGIYTITIYSEKKGPNIMKVLLTDPKSENGEKKDVGPANYYVYPDKVPHQKYTVTISKPKENEAVPVDDPFYISFTLADKFNNSFEGRHDIVDEHYLTLLNNDTPLKVESITLLPDEQTYKIQLYPKYPPKVMNINVLYNDGENAVYIFPENIIVHIKTDIEFDQTQIVSKNKERITVGEVLDMQLYTFDKKGECFDGNYSHLYEVIVTGPLDSDKKFTKQYSVRKNGKNELYECDNEYEIITTAQDKYIYAGNYIIKVYANSKQIAQYNQVCLPLGYSLFYLQYTFDPDHIPVTDTAKFTITGTDMYGNELNDALSNDLEIELSLDGKIVDSSEYEKDKYEGKFGKLDFELDVHKAGSYQLHMYYKGEEITTVNDGQPLPIFTFVPGPCRAEDNSHFDLTQLDGIVTSKEVSFTFQCYDIYNNIITKGGEEFYVSSNLYVDTGSTEINGGDLKDNNNGTYTISFIPDYAGTYVFNIFIDDEKYGEEISVKYAKKTCKGSASILCPNNQCAESYYGCIDPPNECSKEKPFKCKVNKVDTCVKSRVECDCPEGYIKCSYMKYCVPENRPDMCPYFKTRKCQKMGQDIAYYEDGICRKNTSIAPNQRVCPIGKVLCADLSCKDNYDLCPVTPVLPSNKIRCADQTITSYAFYCPSTVTCPSPDQVVCPDLDCVDNEVYCRRVRTCPASYPYLCANNACAREYEDCTSSVVCGDLKSLCADNVCREDCSY